METNVDYTIYYTHHPNTYFDYAVCFVIKSITSKTGKCKIMEFVKKEAEESVNFPVTNLRERIYESTYSKETKMVKSGEKTSFSTPKKAKPQAQVTLVDENFEHIIRNMF
jgi:hypothetical protein